MSYFEERSGFYQAKGKSESISQSVRQILDKLTGSKISHRNYERIFDLLRLIPAYSDKNSFKKKKQIDIDKEKEEGQIK